ncbi:Amino acid permease 6 [Asimina triloba]
MVMKKATFVGISTTTIFYMLCGCAGYAAFGNGAPGNFLTGFGFYEPFWLVDFANVCIAVHLIGAYQIPKVGPIRLSIQRPELNLVSSVLQVFAQPVFQFVETRAQARWPDSLFITAEHAVNVPPLGAFPVNLFRLAWRSAFVIVTAVVAMIFPFFNDFVGLLGAFGFWPLTVYFPTEMYLAHHNIKRFSATWTWLKVLSGVCLIVSIASAAGSVQGLAQHVATYKPFQSPK